MELRQPTQRMFSFLRRGDCHWYTKRRRCEGIDRGWRGNWCRAWMRRHVRKFADFNPATRTASLDPDGLDLRHVLYEMDWMQRAPAAKSGPAIKFSRFAELWKLVVEEGYIHDGEIFAIKIRPPRSGFTCDICQKLYAQRRRASTSSEKDDITHQLKQHLQQARETRDSYSDNIMR